ncbi:major facilitator superfamily transporter [Stachybotrys elegans]|uniref:Major facilitator superfamily transporter n=1 Tax=Stachybotrys elegans TaxID=80388 RepID=A0A8K0WNR8_9HYPO|nr:major facilitator superfamily transporter [Stachybotrys elegans]
MDTDAKRSSGLDQENRSHTESDKISPSEPKETDEEVEARKAKILAEQQELRQQDAPIVPITALFRRRKEFDASAIATQPSVFDDPATAHYFQPHPKYENLHRFDPSFRWTWNDELPLINKMDWRITLWACIAFFGLDLGRGNLSQANTDNFLDDLGMGTNDYNLGNTVYQTSFLLAELPSQMISKKIGPDRWIPFIMCCWSIVSGAQFWLSGRTSFLVTRAILGVLQGGFIPDIVLYLTYFFKSSELPFRLALFWCVRRVTDILAPIIAFGVLRMRGVLGYEGWRWLFLVEGILMLSIGIWSIFMMNPSPTQTRTWYRPNGWFNEKEEKILVNRILRDDPSKGDMHNRQAINFKLLWSSLKDYELWPIYIFGLLWEIPAGPPDQYLTLTLRDLGFGTFDANLLSIPCQFIGAVMMCITTFLSERWDSRAYFGVFTQAWYLPNLIALAVLPSATGPWARYALVTVLLSYPSPHAMHVAWGSRNSHSVRTRAVSAALYNMMVQLARVIYSNIYREDDAPEYRRGNRVLVSIACMNIVVYLIAKGFYVWQNKRRATVWDAMTEDERQNYLQTTKDTGSSRKDVRFVH